MKLIDYFLSNSERNAMQKPMAYFEIYERHFSKFKGKDIKILEIGIEHGGSLAMWKQYFGKGTEVVGIDINPKCRKFEGEGVKIYIGDQADEIFLAHVIGMEGGFDIIIDDGGHLMTQQITSFNILYEAIRDGGVYLCEDTGTSYIHVYGGGLKKEGTFIEMAKSMVDQLYSYESVEVKKSYFSENILGIYFYENIVIFDKRAHQAKDVRVIGKI